MGSYYDMVDVAWGWNGDILPSPQGDIEDTAGVTIQSLIDQISIVVSSSLNDWAIYPSRGTSIEDFVGEANDRNTADRVHDRVRISLVSAGTVNEEDLEVRVVPISIHKLMVIIFVDALSTATNSLENNGPVKVALVFDTAQRQVFFVRPENGTG
jgi:hypothetical protein